MRTRARPAGAPFFRRHAGVFVCEFMSLIILPAGANEDVRCCRASPDAGQRRRLSAGSAGSAFALLFQGGGWGGIGLALLGPLRPKTGLRTNLASFTEPASPYPKGTRPGPLGVWRMGWDSNPRGARTPAGFQDRCLQPLGHPSDFDIRELRQVAGVIQDHMIPGRARGPAADPGMGRDAERGAGAPHPVPLHVDLPGAAAHGLNIRRRGRRGDAGDRRPGDGGCSTPHGRRRRLRR